MRLYLDSSGCFASISSQDTDGRTPFFIACSNGNGGYSKPVFSFLLDRGANVSDLGPEGQSCLHVCLGMANNEWDLEREPEALIFLVAKGADIWARDRAGRSVSHVVYSDWGKDSWLGSYRRDLWDLVLTASGYNALEVRGHARRVGWYPREGHYNSRYTRARFRRLWAGREHLCPYPEDLEDTRSDDALGTEKEVEAPDFPRGSQGETSGTHGHQHEDSDVGDSDVEDSGAEDSGAEDSDAGSSDMKCPIHGDMTEWCGPCSKFQLAGPECRDCGWSFGCRDPNCGCRDDSEDSLEMGGEASPGPQEEDCAMPEAPSPDPAADVCMWSGALRTDSILTHSPDHLSAGMDVRLWLGDTHRVDGMETQGTGRHSSIPLIEMDNPWEDA